MIEVHNLSKTFGTRFTRKNCVLNDISFTLPDKGLVAIFGKSGSGKTTLLNIIGGLDKADKGYVTIEGEKITNKNRDSVRNKKIGFIFQNYYLEPGYSIGEIMHNAMQLAGFNDEEEIKRRTDMVLELVDLKKYQHKSGDALSGGQKQRVAIARALIKGTNILLADEPTGNLDAENTIKVMDILKEISKTKLVVLVTHETSLINKYADSHIELIDGVLQKNTIVEDVEGYKFARDSDVKALDFAESTSKHTGRLFSLKNIVRFLHKEIENTKGGIFKKIFICLMALFMCVFTFMLNETIGMKFEHKYVDENAIYTNLNTYSELSMINNDYYNTIDFFEINQRSATFSYNNVESIASIKENYTPKAIPSNTDKNIVGSLPNENEVLISRALAEQIKHDLRIKELETDISILLMKFNNDYKISGIIEDEEKNVWFNKVDYVNFLGIYNDLKFVDNDHLFFEDVYANMTYSATIALYDGKKDLNDNQVVIDISRNSLYKMMLDTSMGDYNVEMANKELVNKSTAIYIENSEMYVKNFNITREDMDTDVIIYVTQKALDNIFVYLTPNIEKLGNATDTSYYFEISTSGGEQLQNLLVRLKSRGVNGVDILSIYAKDDADAKKESMQYVYIMLIGVFLILGIYYFIEMSESIKNSKEYGVYRAIGVNRGNLLFKETMRVVLRNITLFMAVMIVGTILISTYYGISNISYGVFIGMSALTLVISSLLMIFVSLIPYLFVITKTPSQIISRYDI